MRKLVVEHLYYEKEGKTCCRCRDSSIAVKNAIRQMESSLKSINVAIELKTTLLGEDQINMSNTIKINGNNILDILGEKQPLMTLCPSCTELIGKGTTCQTFTYKGNHYDSVSEQMLAEAILKEASTFIDMGRMGPRKCICGI